MSAVALAATGCAIQRTGPSSVGSDSAPDDWVVVTYEVQDQDPAMLALLDTEMAADEALQAAGAGAIDGNEVGQGAYDMYFVGHDRERMWEILEPILADGPAAWRRAELRDGLDDETPIVIDP